MNTCTITEHEIDTENIDRYDNMWFKKNNTFWSAVVQPCLPDPLLNHSDFWPVLPFVDDIFVVVEPFGLGWHWPYF